MLNIVLWCNGSTTDSGPVCPSSNLGRTTRKPRYSIRVARLFRVMNYHRRIIHNSQFIILFIVEPFYNFLDARLLTVHQDTYPVYLGGKPREADRTDIKQSDGKYDLP